MPLRGIGTTLRPVSPTGWKRGRRLDLEQKSSFMDGNSLILKRSKIVDYLLKFEALSLG